MTGRTASSTPSWPAGRRGPGAGGRATPGTAARASSSSASISLRKASSGTLASTTISPPPGTWTIMSGRRRPSSVMVETCSSKSQCESMPAISTTRRSWISPQRPRVCGERSAVTRLRVSFCSCSWPRCSCATFSLRPFVGALALHLDLLQPHLIAGQRLAQRAQELGDGLLALGEVPLGRRLGLAELRLGQGQELLVVLLQRLGRQLGEGPDQPLALFVRPGPLVLVRLLEQLELCGATARAVSPPRPRPPPPAIGSSTRPTPPGRRPTVPRPCGPQPARRQWRTRCQTNPDARPTTRPMTTPRTTKSA